VTISIGPGDPTDLRVTRMIAESDRYYAALYPAESNHLLDVSSLQAPNVSFLVAREGDAVLGYGALVASPPFGEVKRMYVDTSARRRGIGQAILDAIEQRARAMNLTHLRLETGIHQPEAIALYAARGFVDIRAFGDYKPDPLSRFMEKRIATRSAKG